ncbi:MAG: Tar ligand binding domain-containing protein, partial [Clostridiales bacterium]|nr:Tar ligand binding domain-containing protein [Clostridiales bacterium]
MKNLKIRTKLILGFGLLIAAAVAIVVYSATGLGRLNDEATYLSEHAFVRYSYIRDTEVAMMEARRIMNRISMYGAMETDETSEIRAQEVQYRATAGRAAAALAGYRANLALDQVADEGAVRTALGNVDELERQLQLYWDAIDAVIAASL